MSSEQPENGNSSGDVPEIELIIKVILAFFLGKKSVRIKKCIKFIELMERFKFPR
jgi:hypothetical protein